MGGHGSHHGSTGTSGKGTQVWTQSVVSTGTEGPLRSEVGTARPGERRHRWALTILHVRNWFQKEAPSSKLKRTPPGMQRPSPEVPTQAQGAPGTRNPCSQPLTPQTQGTKPTSEAAMGLLGRHPTFSSPPSTQVCKHLDYSLTWQGQPGFPNTGSYLSDQAGPPLTHRGPKRSRHPSRGSCGDKVPLLRISAEVLEDLIQDRVDRERVLAGFSGGTSHKGRWLARGHQCRGQREGEGRKEETGRRRRWARERESLDSQLINYQMHRD